jgi:hypothetical protein
LEFLKKGDIMKKIIWFLLIALLLVVIIVFFQSQQGPDSKQFDHLLNPTIVEHPDQNMLIVEVKGDPNQTAQGAMKTLYKTYFSLKGVSKDMKSATPRSRWPVSGNTPKDQWIGYFGIPVPANIKTLPEVKNTGNMKVYVTEWKYGTVVEILHKGPYSTVKTTVQRLTDYIDQQGYRIIGIHEEQYLKGPGLLGPGNPDKYLTIISYRVIKK